MHRAYKFLYNTPHSKIIHIQPNNVHVFPDMKKPQQKMSTKLYLLFTVVKDNKKCTNQYRRMPTSGNLCVNL